MRAPELRAPARKGRNGAAEPIMSTVRRRLNESKGTWRRLSRESGVPFPTIAKIAQGVTENPRIASVEKLMRHWGWTYHVPEVK